MALSTARSTPRRLDADSNGSVAYGAAASTTFYVGGLVALNSSGYLTKGAASTTLKAVGVIMEQPHLVPATSYVSSGTNGETQLVVQQGCFKFKNSSTAACTIANIGATVFIEDDETISGTNQSSTLSAAGTMVAIDDATSPTGAGVWVRVGASIDVI